MSIDMRKAADYAKNPNRKKNIHTSDLVGVCVCVYTTWSLTRNTKTPSLNHYTGGVAIALITLPIAKLHITQSNSA